MANLRGTVQKGRLIVDEATSLPEGSVVDLVVDDEGDDLSEDERSALHAAISRAWGSIEAGKGRLASELIAELRSRR